MKTPWKARLYRVQHLRFKALAKKLKTKRSVSPPSTPATDEHLLDAADSLDERQLQQRISHAERGKEAAHPDDGVGEILGGGDQLHDVDSLEGNCGTCGRHVQAS